MVGVITLKVIVMEWICLGGTGDLRILKIRKTFTIYLLINKYVLKLLFISLISGKESQGSWKLGLGLLIHCNMFGLKNMNIIRSNLSIYNFKFL